MIRDAEVSDANAVCNVLTESILKLCELDHSNENDKIDSWLRNKTPENCAIWIGSKYNKSLVAVKDNVVVGVITASRSGYIYLCYVLPDVKGTGLGVKMLNSLEAWLLENGCCELKTDSTHTALGFYTRCGFIQIGDFEVVDGMRSYPLKKQLKL